jgi:hypothetical protein
LDASAVDAEADKGFADRLSAAFAEAPVVFLGSSFVGESGDDDVLACAAQG